MKIWLLAVCAMLAATAAAAPSAIDPRVSKVMAQTRNTRATFSLYSWAVITAKDGEKFELWGAEFHSGSLHRVEAGNQRIVADCKRMTASYLNPQKNQIVDDNKAAREACGVADLKPIRRGVYLGRSDSRFGPVERIQVEDGYTIRTYSVDKRGAIVAQTIEDAKGELSLTMEARELRSWVPHDIFSRESLKRSVVPDNLKTKP